MQAGDIGFLIIGAAKSATTWLQVALQADPRVGMPDPELHFFSRHYDRGLPWYLDQFGAPGPGRLIGEKSNSYLDVPAAAERIARHLPHVRLVAQLRNPIERAYSDYCMLLRRGVVGRDIEAALDPRRAAGGRHLEGGRYAEQLRRFAELFPRKRMHVALYDDMLADPAAHLGSIRSFLGLPAQNPAPLPEAAVKSHGAALLPLSLRRALAPAKPLVRPMRGSRMFKLARGLIARPTRHPAMSSALRARLADYYGAELEALSRFLARDLAAWTNDDGARRT